MNSDLSKEQAEQLAAHIPAGTKRIEVRCYGADGIEIGDSQGVEAEGYKAALSQPAAVEGWRNIVDNVANNLGEFAGAMPTQDMADTLTEYANDLFGLLSAAPTPPSAPVQQSVTEEFKNAQWQQAGWISYWIIGHGLSSAIDAKAFAELQDHLAALSTSPLLDKNDQTEGEIGRLIDQRDNAEEWADRLANAIAQHFDVDVGEHSSLNNPWNEALTAIESPPQPDSNELVEAMLFIREELKAYFRHRDVQKLLYSVGVIRNRIDAALAQSPSVGLNTKKGQ